MAAGLGQSMIDASGGLAFTGLSMGYGLPANTVGYGAGPWGAGGWGAGGWGGMGGGWGMFNSLQEQATQQNQFWQTMHEDQIAYNALMREGQSFDNTNNIINANDRALQTLISAESQTIMNRQSDQTRELEKEILLSRVDAAKCCGETKLAIAQSGAALAAQAASYNTAQQLQVAMVDQDVNVGFQGVLRDVDQASAANLMAGQINTDRVVSAVTKVGSDIGALVLAGALARPRHSHPPPFFPPFPPPLPPVIL